MRAEMTSVQGPQSLLRNVVVTTVEPLEKTAHVETIDPTDFDLGLILDKYVPILFFYRLADNSDATYLQAVTRMKDGLRKMLVPFFPWAGRWVATSGGMQRQLLCNDKGVPFIEAYVDEDMDSVVKISVEFQPILELQGWEILGMDKMAIKQPNVQRPDGMPGLFVQVTRFKCGGLVFAKTVSHMLSDGQSGSDFLVAWSDISRANETDKILDHNRGAVQPSTPRPLSSQEIQKPPTAPGKIRVYEVSASAIKSLKGEARVSVNALFHAHIWKTVSSLPFSITGGRDIAVGTAIGGRTRFYDPTVPNLLGNVYTMMVSPKISTADLVNMPLSLIASKIQASIDFGFGNPLFVAAMNRPAPIHGHTSIVTPPTPGVSSSAACVAITVKYPELLEALECHPDFLPFFLPEEEVKSQLAAHYRK
ncbi:unnamed protein product [Calypogeia fissa]